MPTRRVLRKLLMRELIHAVQQDFRHRAIQQKKDDKLKEADKKATTTPKQVFAEIESRNPELAKLITPQSIDFFSPQSPPVIKGGPRQDNKRRDSTAKLCFRWNLVELV